MFKIVNYGFGNIYSILNMFDYLGIKAKIINTPKDIIRIVLFFQE